MSDKTKDATWIATRIATWNAISRTVNNVR